MEKIETYLTREGWNKDLEETVKRHPYLTKLVGIIKKDEIRTEEDIDSNQVNNSFIDGYFILQGDVLMYERARVERRDKNLTTSTRASLNAEKHAFNIYRMAQFINKLHAVEALSKGMIPNSKFVDDRIIPAIIGSSIYKRKSYT